MFMVAELAEERRRIRELRPRRDALGARSTTPCSPSPTTTSSPTTASSSHPMALPSVGAVCQNPSCNMNDFLPIRCRCERLFCRDHISSESHSCTVNPAARSNPSAISVPMQQCALPGCSRHSLEAFISTGSNTSTRTPALCPQCEVSYCVL